MQKIFTGISYLCVDFSHLQPSLVSIVTSLLLAIESLLHSFQLLAKPFKVLGIGNLIAVTGGNQAS
jgi:hypothetical protein